MWREALETYFVGVLRPVENHADAPYRVRPARDYLLLIFLPENGIFVPVRIGHLLSDVMEFPIKHVWLLSIPGSVDFECSYTLRATFDTWKFLF